MVGIDEDGNAYPLCVNARADVQFIDNSWIENSGGQLNQYDGAYVTILDSNDHYVNPQLLPWLVRRGATFVDTFLNIYVITDDQNKNSRIKSYACSQQNYTTVSYGESGTFALKVPNQENRLNCQGDGVSQVAAYQYDVSVNIDPTQTVAYNNYWVMKALGVPMSIIES